MDWLQIAAGVGAALTAAIHVLAGSNDVARPLLAAALRDEVKYALYACWHFVSAFFIGSAALFLLVGLGTLTVGAGMIALISSLWLLFGALFFGLSWRLNGVHGILRLPQWVLLLPVGLLGFVSLL